MSRGGARPGAGRKKGSTALRSRQIIQAELDKGASPIEFLISVFRDPTVPLKERMQAAKDVAPYMHPKLSAVEAPAKDGREALPEKQLSDLEVARQIAFLLEKGRRQLESENPHRV